MSQMKTLDFNLKISHTTLQDKNKKKLFLSQSGQAMEFVT